MSTKVVHRYAGLLKSLVYALDEGIREEVPRLEFSGSQIKSWKLEDEPGEKAWLNVPAMVEERDGVAVLRGDFEDVRHIHALSVDEPHYWAPLSSRNNAEAQFPVDVSRYPVLELTYRCTAPECRPAVCWYYPGGSGFTWLPSSVGEEILTVSRLLPHNGQPGQISAITIRLYSTEMKESELEIHTLRFRELSAGEQEALRKFYRTSAENIAAQPPRSPLANMFPMGVFMKAGSAKRMASVMDISTRDYWRLAFEDVARHHHNCVAVEELHELNAEEGKELLSMADSFGLRVVAMHNWPLERFRERGQHWIDQYIKPFVDSPSLLAWSVTANPQDHEFQMHLRAQEKIREADPAHPLVAMLPNSGSYPLFAPHFAATGIAHYKTRSAWNFGEIMREHHTAKGDRQLWALAPAFVRGTDSPDWYTCPEMRLMLNQSFANGARGWFAFCYHNDPIWVNGTNIRSLTGPFLTFSDIWSELGHRMERFMALATLFLNAEPGQPDIDFNLTWQVHHRGKHGNAAASIEKFWLIGPDYMLCYILSNDIAEVTPVNVEVPDSLPAGLHIFDMTDFVRSRNWVPMERKRHLEMFPGQGQVILVAPADVCTRWRNRIIEDMVEDDRRQIAMNLSMARRYDLDFSEVQRLQQQMGLGDPLDDLKRMSLAREHLQNILYESPRVAEPRSALIRASAAICACDGSLCRLMSLGKGNQAVELGQQVLPLSRDMTQLRLKLRRGKGMEIIPDCTRLSDDTLRLLGEIRSLV
ncbi:MAG: hypothetical protein HYV27_05555 [Candidatus Hydrogenedentes bacterium]|nr:hypothetical protein [Candidatus Hydrogenedentota bacterium]